MNEEPSTLKEESPNLKEDSKKRKIDIKYWQIGLVAFLVIAALFLLYFVFFKNTSFAGFFTMIWNLLLPFVVGGCIAFVLKPIVQFFETVFHKPFSKMKNRHQAHVIATGISTTITIILALVLLGLIIWLIVPQLYTNVKDLILNLPALIDNAFKELEKITANQEEIHNNIVEWHAQANYYLTGQGNQSLANAAMNWVTNFVDKNKQKLFNIVTSGFSNVFSSLMNILVAAISCIYLLNSRKKFAEQAKLIVYGIFPKKAADTIRQEVHFIDKTFTSFVKGRLVEASIIGILCYIVMKVFRLPYAELISVWVGIANIIPFFGPFIGSIPSCLLLLVTGWQNCLIFLVAILIIGQLDANIIGPKVMGKATGVDSFWVLFAMAFFGGLWGFVGMLIGIPLFAVIYDIIRKFIISCLKKRNQYRMYEHYQETQQLRIEAKEKDKEEKKNRRKQNLKKAKDKIIKKKR